MQHGEIGVGTFLPANQDATKAIEPGVRTFYYPPARFEAGASPDRGCLFATSADVGGEAEGGHEIAHLVVIVSLIEAQSLRRVWGGAWAPGHDRFERVVDELHVVAVSAIDHQRERDTRGFGEETPLDALFASIRRVFARFFEPASGALVIAPSIDSHAQPNPFSLS